MLPQNSPESSFVSEARGIFGIPPGLSPDDASNLLAGLEQLFHMQVEGLQSVRKDLRSRQETFSSFNLPEHIRPSDRDQLIADLDLMRAWFDPVAKGERVREAVSSVSPSRVAVPFNDSYLIKDVGGGRRIVTPEGRTLMSCLRPAIDEFRYTRHLTTEDLNSQLIWLREEDVSACVVILMTTYRAWTRRRLEDVVGLLTSETSTLRPAAAGLLLTLLVNRNTDSSRALPRPSDRRKLQIISEAIAGPAAAYAKALSGSDKTSASTLDLYRGWPLGELRRRMGSSLHSSLGSGIYIEADAVEDAVGRLVTDIRRRPLRLRGRVHHALDAMLAEYEDRRPQLAGLGLAFESPAYTRRLVDTLRRAADEPIADIGSDPGDGDPTGTVLDAGLDDA